MAASISTLISTCPAPVSDAAGVSTALTWLATCEAFCLTQDNNAVPNRHSIINNSEIYLMETPIGAMDSYTEFNNKLMHIKFMLMGVQALTT